MTVNEAYFRFLLAKVNETTHVNLCSILHELEFSYQHDIFSDTNRASDGKELRYEFSVYAGEGVNNVAADEELGALLEKPCSVLEMMVALALRIDSDITGEPGINNSNFWFSTMLINLGLYSMNDSTVIDPVTVCLLVNRFLARGYDEGGRGGLFPLLHPHRDQRLIGIWEQMSDYLAEIRERGNL